MRNDVSIRRRRGELLIVHWAPRIQHPGVASPAPPSGLLWLRRREPSCTIEHGDAVSATDGRGCDSSQLSAPPD